MISDDGKRCVRCGGPFFWKPRWRRKFVCGECLPDDGSVVRLATKILDAKTKETLASS